MRPCALPSGLLGVVQRLSDVAGLFGRLRRPDGRAVPDLADGRRVRRQDHEASGLVITMTGHTNIYGEACGWCAGHCDECGAALPGDDFCENGHDVEHLREECGR